jgi:hypothetical protein
MTYALGHAATVVALGVAVLQLHMVPERLDHDERLIDSRSSCWASGGRER